MSEEAAKVVKSKRKKAASSKLKKPADHPKYSVMVKEALVALKDKKGSSRQAILKYITKNYPVDKDEKKVNAHLKLALRAGAKNGTLNHSKGSGASGSFKIGEKDKKVKAAKPKKVKSPKAAAAKKPKAKKPKAAGTPKAKSPKKPRKPKTPKKVKSPKPKAAKPKKPKTPKKAAKPKAKSAKK